MRVTHLISNLNVGGAEQSLCTLVENMPREVCRHTVVSMLPGGAYAARLREAGAEVVELPGRRSAGIARLLPSLGRALTASEPDLVNCWMYHANLAGSLAARLGYVKAPVLWGIRQSLSGLSNEKPLTRAVILAGVPLRGQPAAIIYNSMRSAEGHEALGYPRAKRVIINNGVDMARFKPRAGARAALVAQLGLPDGGLIVGRVGRKARMKDHGTLFRAIRQVRQSVPNAHLVLVGRNMVSSDPDLSRDIAELGLHDGVHCLGERLDVETIYSAFDVVVSSSSDNEGFPNVIAEAMACGVPAVVTDVGESRALVGDERRVVPPRDPEALAAGIVGVLTQTQEERDGLARAVSASVAERYGIDRTADRFLATWRAALAERRR